MGPAQSAAGTNCVGVSETALEQPGAKYYGVKVGSLKSKKHNVTGDVYIVDEQHMKVSNPDVQHIWIRNFSYDGLGTGHLFLYCKHCN